MLLGSDEVDVTAAITLWRAVIHQALQDRDSRWFSVDNGDFMRVCDYADLDADALLVRFATIISGSKLDTRSATANRWPSHRKERKMSDFYDEELNVPGPVWMIPVPEAKSKFANPEFEKLLDQYANFTICLDDRIEAAKAAVEQLMQERDYYRNRLSSLFPSSEKRSPGRPAKSSWNSK